MMYFLILSKLLFSTFYSAQVSSNSASLYISAVIWKKFPLEVKYAGGDALTLQKGENLCTQGCKWICLILVVPIGENKVKIKKIRERKKGHREIPRISP